MSAHTCCPSLPCPLASKAARLTIHRCVLRVSSNSLSASHNGCTPCVDRCAVLVLPSNGTLQPSLTASPLESIAQSVPLLATDTARISSVAEGSHWPSGAPGNRA